MQRPIYRNIFEAVKYLSPNSVLLQLERDGMLFKRSNIYTLFCMQDGHASAFPKTANFVKAYRGENDCYPCCEPSIYRNNRNSNGTYDDLLIALDKIKIVEFQLILETFPPVQYAIQDNMKVDYLALAQHYGLNTNMIDLTTEIEIAAYFATHKWINGKATIVEDGIGCIRTTPSPLFNLEQLGTSQRVHGIGLQCFQRPGIQAALGIECEKGMDFAGKTSAIYFKQNAQCSNMIHHNFHYDENMRRVINRSWLFPSERIAEVADKVRKSKCITRRAFERYCHDNAVDQERLAFQLQVHGIEIRKRPYFQLTEKELRYLQGKCKESPYGSVNLQSGLSTMRL